MTIHPPAPRRHLLEPMDRLSEIIFGLIMVLTFTGTLSAADSGHETVRTMLIAALGCNVAWGIVDAVMYLMACMAERGRRFHLLRGVQGAKDPATGRRLLVEGLPDEFGPLLGEDELEAIRVRMLALPPPASPGRLGRREAFEALAVCAWVIVTTLPVVIPFLFVRPAMTALRVSNAVALVMLFATGYALGRISNRRPIVIGLLNLLIGVILVAVTIALGG